MEIPNITSLTLDLRLSTDTHLLDELNEVIEKLRIKNSSMRVECRNLLYSMLPSVYNHHINSLHVYFPEHQHLHTDTAIKILNTVNSSKASPQDNIFPNTLTSLLIRGAYRGILEQGLPPHLYTLDLGRIYSVSLDALPPTLTDLTLGEPLHNLDQCHTSI
ncbi:hypothetical protein SAMD00019534_071790 [Acytostelium subglobosum LB1]|uniref:hypothetical protein n=1 Tax=Acytostelium subglobosum LB1 TaxID=1410327 RepID=UPI000644E13E|nr:hypothetical protein SAMD00019534_071790 [Acytostelium subglobosum LB1]GAM24004.1 hypothetical protein SAMD00019534_071790 [Acytostelium subglobosum LB1]|eukprot:XP_012753040.1 hypothetical protein SAMD00019534_071790 [Acytostelium subglobosum LB1]